MKNYILILIFGFLLIEFSQAQEPIPLTNYESYYDTTWKRTLKSGGGSNYAPYGEVFTPKGTIRILIIFAKFSNDADQDCGT